MPEYAQLLGTAVRTARKKKKLTQVEVANSIDIECRTLVSIESHKGNPKMEVLYPLIRALHIDPREIFYPEIQQDNPAIFQLRLLLEECTDEEAEALIPIIRSILEVLRSKNTVEIK
jgi:DNA-binding XRE family transcriptional regulator